MKKQTYLSLSKDKGNEKHGISRYLALSLCMLTFIGASAQTGKVNLKLNNAPVKELFNAIEKQTPYRFSYRDADIKGKQNVTVSSQDESLKELLTRELAQRGLSYRVSDNLIIILPAPQTPASKTNKITGVVKDANGEPIIGANITVKGQSIGTITDIDGRFTLDVPAGAVLQASFIGFTSQDIEVGNQRELAIALKEDTEMLDEVVVIGYGTSRKRNIVSAMSTVKGEVFKNASTTNVKDVLQGRVAGLDVDAARYPGDDRGITIRGVRSLNAGNDPLIIVDGVPGSLGSVNSYDIESIEVLKDAASTAIYGSMGANGVILVTTKRSKKGVRREVNFNSYLGISIPHMIPMQSGEEYVQFRRDCYRYAHGWDTPFTDENVFDSSELAVIQNGNYTDWQDLIYRKAFNQSYHLSISNSGEKTRLFLSLKYDKEQGYYKTNEMENINLTFTADHDLADFWTIGTTIRLRRNNNDGYSSVSTDLMYMSPLAIPYKENGELNYYPNPQNSSGYNPLADYVPGQYANNTQGNTVQVNFTSNIKISKHLSMQTNFGYIFSDKKNGYFYGTNSYRNKGGKTSSGKTYSNGDQYTFNNILTYNNTWKDHHLIIDLIGEIQKSTSDDGSMSGEKQPVDYTLYHNLATNTENIKIGSGYSEWALASGLMRLRYDFKNKYYINIAMRADGSSRLAPGHKWALFPSGGIAWSIKDEAFLQNTYWINTLKLRYSYGAVGNTAISPYQTQASLTQYPYLFGDDNKFYTYRPSSMVNLDLGWEISRTSNLGLDFGFWNNKLHGYIEIYQTKTSDLLMQRKIPTFTGFSQIWQNIGKTENKGFEFNLNYSPVRTNNLNIDIYANASRNWEKIVALVSGEDMPNNQWFIGKPLGVYYDYEKIGIWQIGEESEATKYNATVGDIKIKDQDGDGTISAANDKVILGQTRPKWIVSLGSNINYKNLDFSFNLTSKWGHLIHPVPYNDISMDGQKWLPSIDYWTPDNPTNDYPKADQSDGYDSYKTSNGYQKGDFIKLQDITIGYSFEKHLAKWISLKKARVYFQIRNAAYLYKAAKYDITPEAPNFSQTVPTSYNFGINITF